MEEALRQNTYIDKYSLNSVRLLAMTGCRCSEIMTLKWKYIDFESQVFRFPETKTGAQNRPFGIAAKTLLLKMKMEIHSESDEEFVFPRVKKTSDVSKNIFKRSIPDWKIYALTLCVTVSRPWRRRWDIWTKTNCGGICLYTARRFCIKRQGIYWKSVNRI